MTKQKIIAVLNILAGLFSLVVVIQLIKTPLVLGNAPIDFYIAPTILTLIAVFNFLFAYKILKSRKADIKRDIGALVSLHIFAWTAILFIGYFFASEILFTILVVLFIATVIFISRQYALKLIIFLSIITTGISLYTIANGIEEDYCWKLADETKSQYPEWVEPETEEEKQFVGGASGHKISGWMRAHFKCHKEFNLLSVLKERYLFLK